MQRDPLAVADRLERYFDWYLRVDPDVTPEAVELVTRFVRLAGAPSPREAKALLRESDGIVLGSAWEEMRATLKAMAR